jgi:hypothetical protein
MTELKFNEADYQKASEFLNMVAKTATFSLNTVELINYFKLLAHMQQFILPKINANILEVIKVVETPEPSPEKRAAKSKA